MASRSLFGHETLKIDLRIFPAGCAFAPSTDKNKKRTNDSDPEPVPFSTIYPQRL